MENSKSLEALIDVTESITFIPLEEDDIHLLGSTIDLIPLDDSYILVDRLNCSIFRYSKNGTFLNQIGSKGRGPAEYANIESVQWYNDDLIVFCEPDKVLYYNKDGNFDKAESIEGKGRQSFYTDDGVLTYYSYLPNTYYRAAMIKGDKVKWYIPSSPTVMTYSSDVPIFSSNGEDVFLIDSYNNSLFRYSEKNLDSYLTFDFGKYSIPDSFYDFEDPYEAMFFLSDINFALINRYFESDSYKLAEVFIQSKDDVEYKYAIESNGIWRWFGENAGHWVFSNSFRALKGKVLYCLISPENIGSIPAVIQDLSANPESLNNITEDSNYVVAEIRLK